MKLSFDYFLLFICQMDVSFGNLENLNSSNAKHRAR